MHVRTQQELTERCLKLYVRLADSRQQFLSDHARIALFIAFISRKLGNKFILSVVIFYFEKDISLKEECVYGKLPLSYSYHSIISIKKVFVRLYAKNTRNMRKATNSRCLFSKKKAGRIL